MRIESMDEIVKTSSELIMKLTNQKGILTPDQQNYIKFAKEYHQAVSAWNDSFAAARKDPFKLQNWPIDGVLYENRIEEAFDRWLILGKKEETERNAEGET
jgi:hypothetical protein